MKMRVGCAQIKSVVDVQETCFSASLTKHLNLPHHLPLYLRHTHALFLFVDTCTMVVCHHHTQQQITSGSAELGLLQTPVPGPGMYCANWVSL